MFEDSQFSQNQDVVARAAEQHNPPPRQLNRRKTTSRKRYSYRKRKIVGKHNLFLNPAYLGQFREKFNENFELEGSIVTCPNKKENADYYVLTWCTSGTELHKSPWIQTILDNNADNKRILKDACERYVEKFPSSNSGNASVSVVSVGTNNAGNLQNNPTTPANNQQEANEEGGRESNIPASAAAVQESPTLPIRAAAAAALGTASTYTTYSQLSSLSGSGNTARSGQSMATRSSADPDIESDTDDGDELDENDNAYIPLLPGQTVEDVDNENDGQDNPEDVEGTSNLGDIGTRIANLQWKYREAREGETVAFEVPELSREETRLKEGVADKFSDPFTALKVLGGFDIEFVSRLARNSNAYANKTILKNHRNHKVHNLLWTKITVPEMYAFLGIMLKISLSPIDGGGYTTYFNKKNATIRYCRDCDGFEIPNSKGFAVEYMSLERFKQIRMAYHPEDKVMGRGGDKCYQLRYAMAQCNNAALACFIIGAHMTFDEGGIGCRSRFCPVRMYNSQKPDKFRVDLFILACAVSYVIFHVDVYQGKNETNVEIDPAILDLPTTQKAPMNAIMK